MKGLINYSVYSPGETVLLKLVDKEVNSERISAYY